MINLRKQRSWQVSFFALAIITAIVAHGCNDFGLEANYFKGTIRGEIRIDTPVPRQTDEIRVALSPDFPPSDFRQLQISEVLPVNRSQSVTEQVVPFEMHVPYGRYEATVVIWKEKAKNWSLTDIVGLHGNLEKFELTAIELSKSHPVEENVSIGVELERVNRTASVTGHIEIIGPWPENTFVAGFVMLEDFGQLARGELPPVLVFIPFGTESFDFKTSVSAGTYQIVAVGWLPRLQEGFDLSLVEFVGIYDKEDMPGEPKPITVNDGDAITGINITVDFSTLD